MSQVIAVHGQSCKCKRTVISAMNRSSCRVNAHYPLRSLLWPGGGELLRELENVMVTYLMAVGGSLSPTRAPLDNSNPAVFAAECCYLWLERGRCVSVHRHFRSQSLRVIWTSALGSFQPFLLPAVSSCLKCWSCTFSARALFRLAFLRLTGWARYHPSAFLACPISCSVLGSSACCFWPPSPINSAGQRLQFVAASGSVDRAWVCLSCPRVLCVQEHLSSGCLNLCHLCWSGGRSDRALKWNSGTVSVFLWEQGF